MAAKSRGFSPSGIKKKQDDYHGGCSVFHISPDVRAKGVQSVNMDMSFEDALRLSTAIQSAILNLNKYNRSTKIGKQMGLCLSLKLDAMAISVIEVPLRVRPK